jgi:hypothetical protein
MWLGLTDEKEEGKFVWESSQEAANYTNWHSGEPNNDQGDERCVSMWKDAGQWNDLGCNTYLNLPQVTMCELVFPC